MRPQLNLLLLMIQILYSVGLRSSYMGLFIRYTVIYLPHKSLPNVIENISLFAVYSNKIEIFSSN